jgi:hypothetical protein
MGMNGIVAPATIGRRRRSAPARNTKQVGVAFFGDGASASPHSGAVRSCANLKLPVIFVAENSFKYGRPDGHHGAAEKNHRVPKGLDILIAWTATTSRRSTPRRRKPSSGRAGKGRR